MKICLIGNGLTNLVLAKNLVKKKIKVDLITTLKKDSYSELRTIGISNQNLVFLNKFFGGIEKISWPINEIKIFNEFNQNQEIMDFYKSEKNFSIFKAYKLYNLMKVSLFNENFFSFKYINKKSSLLNIVKNNNYDLFINSEKNNEISKKFFHKKIIKKYNSKAYITIIKHTFCDNMIAKQIFTDFGPLAFLPISNTETSIVFSIFKNKVKEKDSNEEIKNLIIKYNKNYNIKSFGKFENFNLISSLSRTYFYKNILCFGDNLHRIHPLAGQGFNMSIRDIKTLSSLIDKKIELGLPLDLSILSEFEKKTKHLNFIFANGVDFIHEFFKLENKIGNNYSKEIFRFLEKNKYIKNYFLKFADKGLVI